MGTYNETQTVMVHYHGKEEPWGRTVKGYFGIVLSFAR